ncbi:MAG: hypothetical protein ACOYNI_11255 [Acidimicrobiia bacterium]
MRAETWAHTVVSPPVEADDTGLTPADRGLLAGFAANLSPVGLSEWDEALAAWEDTVRSLDRLPLSTWLEDVARHRGTVGVGDRRAAGILDRAVARVLRAHDRADELADFVDSQYLRAVQSFRPIVPVLELDTLAEHVVAVLDCASDDELIDVTLSLIKQASAHGLRNENVIVERVGRLHVLGALISFEHERFDDAMAFAEHALRDGFDSQSASVTYQASLIHAQVVNPRQVSNIRASLDVARSVRRREPSAAEDIDVAREAELWIGLGETDAAGTLLREDVALGNEVGPHTAEVAERLGLHDLVRRHLEHRLGTRLNHLDACQDAPPLLLEVAQVSVAQTYSDLHELALRSDDEVAANFYRTQMESVLQPAANEWSSVQALTTAARLLGEESTIPQRLFRAVLSRERTARELDRSAGASEPDRVMAWRNAFNYASEAAAWCEQHTNPTTTSFIRVFRDRIQAGLRRAAQSLDLDVQR